MSVAAPDPDALRERLLALEQLGRAAARGAAARVARARCELAMLVLGGEPVGVPVTCLEALVRSPDVVPVPGAQVWVLGALRHGPRMLAVLDPGWALDGTVRGHPAAVATAAVLRVAGIRVAVPAQAVHGVTGDGRRCAEGAGDAAVRQLDVEGLAARLERPC